MAACGVTKLFITRTQDFQHENQDNPTQTRIVGHTSCLLFIKKKKSHRQKSANQEAGCTELRLIAENRVDLQEKARKRKGQGKVPGSLMVFLISDFSDKRGPAAIHSFSYIKYSCRTDRLGFIYLFLILV